VGIDLHGLRFPGTVTSDDCAEGNSYVSQRNDDDDDGDSFELELPEPLEEYVS
jgi:hypothetical protein